jgi:hypothetical protein
MYAKLKFIYEWQGRHPSGSVGFSNGGWCVRFNDKERKTFNVKVYPDAEKRARDWQSKKSLEKGLTRNQYRVVIDEEEGKYIEMKLQRDFVVKFDEEYLPLATKCIWSAKKGWDSKQSTYYMEHSGKGRKGIPPERFHRLLLPQFSVIDHINRDGLDNRLCNLRDGSGIVNARNQSMRKDNHSGKTGVHYSKTEKVWTVQYPKNGIRKSKKFSEFKHGSDKAKSLAMEFRKTIDEKENICNGYQP